MDPRERAAEVVATERIGMDLPDIFWAGLQVQIEEAIRAHAADFESQLAASQERVVELSVENSGLRSDLASVCVWLCDWDEGVESANAVALAKHVKEVCKERGHRLTEQRARAETAEQRVAELEREIASMQGLPPYRLGYIDGRQDAAAAVSALEERYARMGHIETVEDALDHATREAAGEVTETAREDLLARAETAERERDEAVARADEAEKSRCRHGWRGSVPREGESIANHCPSCGGRSLFIGSGGWLTCANLSCPDPSMRTYLGKATRPDPDRSEAGGEENHRG